ncbi:hypothetical protein GW17_00009387 [Ensete ventricosum]|nr:hypothetical protein GW17_00009387 [Ensete ventricosum]
MPPLANLKDHVIPKNMPQLNSTKCKRRTNLQGHDRPIGTSNNIMRWRISGVGTWHVSDASDRTTHPDLQSRCRRRVPEGTVNHDACHDSDSELLLEGSSSTAAETWPQILVLVERRNTGERPSIRHPIVKLWDPHPTTNRRSSSCASAASLIHEPLLNRFRHYQLDIHVATAAW